MSRSTRSRWGMSVGVALLAACGGGAADAPSGSLTTFKRLQAGVLEPSCASSSCHSTATAAGGLVLTGGGVYASLVNAAPTVQGARDAGLKRVMPGDPARSLLWHKLDWAAGHHGADYGDAMPLQARHSRSNRSSS